MQCTRGASLTINAPEFFEDPVFMAWLNNSQRKMTWHIPGNAVADEYSDVMVFVEPSLNGEGSDSDMPEYIWNQIVEACRNHCRNADLALGHHIAVRLTNLQA